MWHQHACHSDGLQAINNLQSRHDEGVEHECGAFERAETVSEVRRVRCGPGVNFLMLNFV